MRSVLLKTLRAYRHLRAELRVTNIKLCIQNQYKAEILQRIEDPVVDLSVVHCQLVTSRLFA
jgi:hypothetical protein